MKSRGVRVASGAESTSSVCSRAAATPLRVLVRTCASVILSMCSICCGLVEMNTWIRARSASRSAPSTGRRRTAAYGTTRRCGGSWADTDRAGDRLHGFEVTLAGHRESGLDVVDTHPGQLLAISSFSATSREIPGDCSPSRRVVSKTTRCPSAAASDRSLPPATCSACSACCLHSHRPRSLSSLPVPPRPPSPRLRTTSTLTVTAGPARLCGPREAPWPFGAGGVSASAMWRSPSSKKQVRDEHMHT